MTGHLLLDKPCEKHAAPHTVCPQPIPQLRVSPSRWGLVRHRLASTKHYLPGHGNRHDLRHGVRISARLGDCTLLRNAKTGSEPLPPSPAAIRRVQTLCSPENKRPESDAITQSSAGVTNEWVWTPDPPHAFDAAHTKKFTITLPLRDTRTSRIENFDFRTSQKGNVTKSSSHVS
jgi:hypothetical protein